jgi:phage tail-like protein
MADLLAYPLPTFHFSVDLGGTVINCQEISGLNIEVDVIEYRNGDSKIFSKQKMSGLKKFGDISIKKGVFKDDKAFYTWLDAHKGNVPLRKDVIVILKDEGENAIMTWTLINCWPKKISSPTLSAEKSEVAVESIDVVCEGITIK